jgi:apolipoprotein N-acyltransferase
MDRSRRPADGRQWLPRLAPFAALLAGAALPLAFAPFDWVWLAVLAPAVLFGLVAMVPARAALCS